MQRHGVDHMALEALEPGVLERDGCSLHYWVGGPERATLVAITHGGWCATAMFDAQVAALIARYRVLVWDVRGHGLSRPAGGGFTIRGAAADLLALLDHLGCAAAILVGHSMGGNISQELVWLHPERVLALAVVGCTCNTLPLPLVDRLMLPLTGPLLRAYPAALLRRQSGAASALRPAVQAYLRAQFRSFTGAELSAILVETTRCLHPEPGYRIVQPLLLTHGAADRTGNIRRVAPRWAVREPHCRYVVIPDASHCAHQDQPVVFNALLSEFLATHAPSGAA